MIPQKRSLIRNRFSKYFSRKSSQKRFIRYSIISANFIVLAVVIIFVISSSHTDHTLAASAVSATAVGSTQPVDGLTSYDIAANVARMTDLPESTAISNQAQSAQAAVAVSASDSNVIAKPQIVATALKSRDDIKTYVAQAGDTVASIAQKYSVTSDSIKWSNNLSTDTVALGAKLVIPPVNGIVYTVQAGDTVQTLATKYKANADQITAYNDAEINGIKTGEQILIPNGQIVATTTTRSTSSSSIKVASSFTPTYGNNGYDYGYCTWYVASRIAVPTNWGNANTWAYYAAQSGWTVSSVPRAGAIAQTSRGYDGHVAIVEQVSADGSQIIYSDMNGINGWGRVGTSGWVSASYFEHYLYQ